MNISFKKPKVNLNMLIAQTHQLSSRLIGMQLTTGSLIGIILSATQMSAGFLLIGQGLIKGSALLAMFVAIIGIALAVLIERLSIGGLSSVRVANERRKMLTEVFYGHLHKEKREATDAEKDEFKRQESALKADRNIGIAFGALGMVLSAGVGDVFWHTLFESLPIAIGYILSTSCALVIGLTFIHGELFKRLIDNVLKETLSDMSLIRVAVASEEQQLQVNMMIDAYREVREDEAVRQPAEDKIRRTVAKRLSGFADATAAAGDQVASYNMSGQSFIETTVSYPQGLPAPRGKYGEHRDELRRLLRANPNMSDREIAKHFSISNSTANAWKAKYLAGE